MTRFIERYPLGALLILVVIVAALWLIFAVWPPGLEAVVGKKKLFLNATFQRDHARRPLFPRRQRLHADLRAVAQRQSRTWLDLSPRRVFRLPDGRCDRLVAAELRRRLHRRRPRRRRHADRRLPPHGGAGHSPDARDDRHFDRAGRPDAVGFRRRFLADPDAGLAARADGASFRHRGQVFRRSCLSHLSDRAPCHLGRFRRHRPRDVARPQSHSPRHDRARRRRRSRYARCDGRAHSTRLCDRVCFRSGSGGDGGGRRRNVPVALARAKTLGFCSRR